MIEPGIILSAGVGFLIALAGLKLILLQTSRRGLASNGRELHHTHVSPVPRIGGLALAVAFAATAALTGIFGTRSCLDEPSGQAILVGTLCMFGLGFLDDLRPVGARRKLLGQVLISVGVYAAGIGINRLKIPLTAEAMVLTPALSLAVTVLWLVALTNLINLIDGVDGLAGGISLMLMVLLAYVGHGTAQTGLLCAGMAGALLAFLHYNFPPARIFMGDGGAYMLGFLVGTTTIVSSNKGTVFAALAAPLFVMALPILDTALAILRRGLRGLPLFRADRKHIHHHLLSAWGSQRKVVLGLYCFTLLFLALGFALVWSRGQWLPVLLGTGVLLVLLAAGKLSFSREWFAVGRVVGNSLQMRTEVQYALALARWLELEGARGRSVEELWTDLAFIARKLNCAAVKLQLEDGERTWSQASVCPHLKNLRVPLEAGRLGVLELGACVCPMNPERKVKADDCAERTDEGLCIADCRLFEILGDILAEGWLQAARKCARGHRWAAAPLRFDMTPPGRSPASTTPLTKAALAPVTEV